MRIWFIKLLVSSALSLTTAAFIRSDLFDKAVGEPLMGAAAPSDPLRDLPAALAQVDATPHRPGAARADPAPAALPPDPAPQAGHRWLGAAQADPVAPAALVPVRVNRTGGSGNTHRRVRMTE